MILNKIFAYTYIKPFINTQISDPIPQEVVYESIFRLPVGVVWGMIKGHLGHICVVVGVHINSIGGNRLHSHCAPPSVATYTHVRVIAHALIRLATGSVLAYLAAREEKFHFWVGRVMLPVVVEESLEGLQRPRLRVRARTGLRARG